MIDFGKLVKGLARLSKDLSSANITVKAQKTGTVVKYGKHVLFKVPDEQYGKMVATALKSCCDSLSKTIDSRLQDARARCEQTDLFSCENSENDHESKEVEVE